MIFMIRGRQTGKSTRLLHWLMARPNRCIIVVNEPRKDDLQVELGDRVVAQIIEENHALPTVRLMGISQRWSPRRHR